MVSTSSTADQKSKEVPYEQSITVQGGYIRDPIYICMKRSVRNKT
jgi:plastocyanin domain-containing protein